MTSPWLGEFLGTMILILLGDGVVAAVLLKRSKAEGSGWMVITTGWALAVMAGVFTAIACGSSDAHLNPAALQSSFRISWHKCWERSLAPHSCGCIIILTGKRRQILE